MSLVEQVGSQVRQAAEDLPLEAMGAAMEEFLSIRRTLDDIGLPNDSGALPEVQRALHAVTEAAALVTAATVMIDNYLNSIGLPGTTCGEARPDIRESVPSHEYIFKEGLGAKARSTFDGFKNSRPDRDRTYEKYCELLDIKLADFFKGKTIVDLGTGMTARFAAEARQHDITVIPVNPSWGRADFRRQALDKLEKDPERDDRPQSQRWSAAVVQQLPFRTGSLDGVVAVNSVPTYLPGTARDYIAAFSNIGRILKPDGFAILFPFEESTRHPLVNAVLTRAVGPRRYAFRWSKEYLTAMLLIAGSPEARNELEKAGLAEWGPGVKDK